MDPGVAEESGCYTEVFPIAKVANGNKCDETGEEPLYSQTLTQRPQGQELTTVWVIQTKLRLFTASDTNVMMIKLIMEKTVLGTANRFAIGRETKFGGSLIPERWVD
jgi:hypothetical protein